MPQKTYDIILIGCGSGGLSIGLFMAMTGFKVLMVSKTDNAIGGDCLNDGCVPSKAFIHVAKIVQQAKEAANFGLEIKGSVDIKKVVDYIYQKQELIRAHENTAWLRAQGITVALGNAFFTGKDEIEVDGIKYKGKKIVIATGSTPKKLLIAGVDKVAYYDNESIFNLKELPKKMLVIGGGPIGIEIAQTLNRLGTMVTVVHKGDMILDKDDKTLAAILLDQLKKEGIKFLLNAETAHFISANEALLNIKGIGTKTITFDAVFVAIGRSLNVEKLKLQRAGVDVKQDKIVLNACLQTTNKNIFACGDVAGGLQFSHATEFHARLLINNFFSPFKKKLNNDQIPWVTFTDPELASFGLNEYTLVKRNIAFEKLVQDFKNDDRAVTDNYRYAKLILFISKKKFLKKQQILGGSMIAPHAGELVQELILANTAGLSINKIFDKIYPYPTAARINQMAIVNYKSKSITPFIKTILQKLYKLFG